MHVGGVSINANEIQQRYRGQRCSEPIVRLRFPTTNKSFMGAETSISVSTLNRAFNWRFHVVALLDCTIADSIAGSAFFQNSFKLGSFPLSLVIVRS